MNADFLFDKAAEMGYELRPMSPSSLRQWLERLIPPLIYQRMVCSRAVKVCSTISPVASQVSLERGYPIFVKQVPGHFYNVAITPSSIYKVDLSAIQFRVGKIASTYAEDDDDEDDPFGEERAIYDLIEEVGNNPYLAVEIKELPPSSIQHGMAIPYDEEFNFELAERAVARARVFTGEDPSVLDLIAKQGMNR